MERDFYISMVIDKVDDHPYKADLLIRTLQRNADLPADRIILNHVTGVDAGTLSVFRRYGCKLRAIEPFLDTKYCNKLQQVIGLSALGLRPLAGLLLLDIDIAVAAPCRIPTPDKICGKIVDAPNPPIRVLSEIFAAAQVEPPPVIPCDWGTGETYATNFNGGVLFIPAHYIDPFGAAWRSFAKFLFDERETFQGLGPHIDQVSFALALSSTRLPYSQLSAADNFPVHYDQMPRSFVSGDQIRALHYHWQLDDFGFVRSQVTLPEVEGSLAIVNRSAATTSDPGFYDGYKRGKLRRRDSAPESAQHTAFRDWAARAGTLPRIVFHVGTPKTGTKSFQYILENNRSQLLEQGIWYPSTLEHPELKHQVLVGLLQSDDGSALTTYLVSVLNAIPPGVDTIVFSTEGLYNHWRDFSQEGRSVLRALASAVPVHVMVCFRDPVDFAASLYCQYLINPPVHPCYGTDKSFEVMLEVPWFKRHLDYAGFVMEAEEILGAEDVRIFRYSQDVLQQMLNYLGISLSEPPAEYRNTSMSREAIEAIRILNSERPEPAARSERLAHIMAADRETSAPRAKFALAPAAAQAIRSLTQKTMALLDVWAADPAHSPLRAARRPS